MTKTERHYTLLFRQSGRGMQECFHDARRHIHFITTLKASVAQHAKRSKAAKKAAATRKART